MSKLIKLAGEVLWSAIEKRKGNVHRAAKAMRVPPGNLANIINGTLGISKNVAARAEIALGLDGKKLYLLHCAADYDRFIEENQGVLAQEVMDL